MPAPDLTVIGLDAATFTVIDPMLEAGQLPNLQRIFERGSRGVLRSTTHPLTPQAWTTMVTGVNAGRHGIWDFAERDPNGYHLKLVNGSFRRAPAVWDHLRARGRTVGFVNVPFTWPAPDVDGFLLSGFDAAAREEGMSCPPSLMAEIRQRFGDLTLDHRLPVDSRGTFDLDWVRRAIEQRVEIVKWLTERFDPNLLFVVFMSADHVQHVGWAEWEQKGPDGAVGAVYRMLDEAVGELVGNDESRNVMLVSDHGAGRLDGVVNLNHWLEAHGYLSYGGATARLQRDELKRRLFRNVYRLRYKLPYRLRNAVK